MFSGSVLLFARGIFLPRLHESAQVVWLYSQCAVSLEGVRNEDVCVVGVGSLVKGKHSAI